MTKLLCQCGLKAIPAPRMWSCSTAISGRLLAMRVSSRCKRSPAALFTGTRGHGFMTISVRLITRSAMLRRWHRDLALVVSVRMMHCLAVNVKAFIVTTAISRCPAGWALWTKPKMHHFFTTVHSPVQGLPVHQQRWRASVVILPFQQIYQAPREQVLSAHMSASVSSGEQMAAKGDEVAPAGRAPLLPSMALPSRPACRRTRLGSRVNRPHCEDCPDRKYNKLL
mmetsp:Transcript_90044/g.227120  ORF Transcript_90044/g.227120 Transcript_90044/m.227120 type:complete len:225 (-) Transcript_90044:186-860(-)